MNKLLSLANLKETGTTDEFGVGKVTACWSSTYGSLKAIYVHSCDAVGVLMSPMFPDLQDGWPTGFYADDDENKASLVIGQEFCIGPYLQSAATTAASYGWVLVAGLNPLAMTTDGTAAAGYGIRPSATDGSWSGVAATTTETGSAVAYNTHLCGIYTTADTCAVLAAGYAQINTILGALPVTL